GGCVVSIGAGIPVAGVLTARPGVKRIRACALVAEVHFARLPVGLLECPSRTSLERRAHLVAHCLDWLHPSDVVSCILVRRRAGLVLDAHCPASFSSRYW